ncbi:MAG: glycosyltransferase family 39 protein [Kyrpidia sp.]|nr:glycosyltransferase family 39 protein [Kyrpidia sp.]
MDGREMEDVVDLRDPLPALRRQIPFGLAAVLLLGIVLRLGWIWAVNTQPISDFRHYHDLALSLLRHGRYEMPEGLDYIKADTPYVKTGVHYPTAFRPPGYPFFLAAVYAVYPSILAAKLANVCLDVAWMVSVYVLGAAAGGRRTGLWASGAAAVFPTSVAYSSVLGTETLAAALLTAIAALHVRGADRGIGGMAALGALMGALALVKPYYAAMPVLYALLQYWRAREEGAAGGRRRGLRRLNGMERAEAPANQPPKATAGSERNPGRMVRGRAMRAALGALLVSGAAAALVIAPWSVRNALVFHRIVPISTNGDFVLYINNNDSSRGMYMDPLQVPGSIFKTDRVLGTDGVYNEAVAMARAKDEAQAWIRAHPAGFVRLGFDRVSASYFNLASDVADWAVAPAQLRIDGRWVEPLLQGARAAVLAVVGGGWVYVLAMGLRWMAGRGLPAVHRVNVLMIAFVTAVIFVSEGQPRYLFPIYSFFIVGAVWAGRRAADV